MFSLSVLFSVWNPTSWGCTFGTVPSLLCSFHPLPSVHLNFVLLPFQEHALVEGCHILFKDVRNVCCCCSFLLFSSVPVEAVFTHFVSLNCIFLFESEFTLGGLVLPRGTRTGLVWVATCQLMGGGPSKRFQNLASMCPLVFSVSLVDLCIFNFLIIILVVEGS